MTLSFAYIIYIVFSFIELLLHYHVLDIWLMMNSSHFLYKQQQDFYMLDSITAVLFCPSHPGEYQDVILPSTPPAAVVFG